MFSFNRLASLDDARALLTRYRDHYRTRNVKQYLIGNRRQRQWLIQAARTDGDDVHHRRIARVEVGSESDPGTVMPETSIRSPRPSIATSCSSSLAAGPATMATLQIKTAAVRRR